MRRLAAIVVIAAAVFATKVAWTDSGYDDGLSCVRTAFGIKSNKNTGDYREFNLAPDEWTQLVSDISARSGLALRPQAVACDQVSNAAPFVPKADADLPENLKQSQFVLYNRIYMRTLLADDRDWAIFILGHELGHITKHHIDTRMFSISRFEQESEADYEGACTVAKLGGRLETIYSLLPHIRDPVDGDYPSIEHSRAIARRAFDDEKCKVKPVDGIDVDAANVEVIYFYKRADEGRAVDALSRIGVTPSVRQSGVYKGVDYSDQPTDSVTCHAGVPIDFVRKVALALFDKGVAVRAINKPDTENARLEGRIIIESTARTRPTLTRDQIEALDNCPSQLDPVYGKGR